MEAPYVIVVQGPRNSGKTTVIKSLVRHYTRQKLTDVRGPITLRANRSLRLCFYECPTEMSAMIDLAKIADLALIVIDASVGFELETFEFISILQNHGMPCVMGILTHLDQFKEASTLRKIKKVMKKRFWAEVYNGAKLFYLSGLKNDLYTDREIHNFTRFISVLKWKEMTWRQEHSYILADRFEMKRDTGESAFYGYIRGCPSNENNFFIPGYGEFEMTNISEIQDPVPQIEAQKKKKTHRTLKQKERALYAPSSNIGMLKYDNNTGYINLPDQYVMFTKHQGENIEEFTPGQKMVRELQEADRTLEDKLAQREDLALVDDIQVRAESSESEIEEENHLKELAEEIKTKLPKKEVQEYTINDTVVTDLTTLVYGKKSQGAKKVMEKDTLDSFKERYKPRFDSLDNYIKAVKNRFMAGSDYKEEIEKEAEDDMDGEDIEKEIEDAPKSEKNGIPKGTYVKIEIKGMSEELFEKIVPECPILLCGLKPLENSLGYVRARFKKHRWAKKILKNNDPLVISMGWRRFQTIPIFCTEDSGTDRLRMVKYTPKFGFCMMVFYGPLSAVNTPIMAIQDLEGKDFRISGSGIILELNSQFSIMKKLKLIGEPYKVFKNTAFVKGMFNSQLEVTRFEGAKIKTVSGIRGMIKKSSRDGIGPPGTYRATFEDKILMSDIIFLRTYYEIKPEKFYNPIINYAKQRLLKTTSQIRTERGIVAPDNEDSHYNPVIREKKEFTPFKVPKKLEEELPFKSKQKLTQPKQRDETDVKIMLNDREKKIAFFLQRLGTVKNMRVKHEKEKKEKYDEEIAKKQKKEDDAKREALSRKIKERKMKKNFHK
ncbi:unnamed protein product [Blepharisma stoltei]|uniref:Bms1-type G domain-containing protein n=1 Tax=Blepharisma stoltei TaxID=1481888 RepID=A0AAU9K1L4_9CILI|nr:unnamed protein product [Blepharisma stoltei]